MNIENTDNKGSGELLKEGLLEMIRKSAINSRLPSERSLAEKFGVCRATVNKVMDELEHEGYVSRRVGKGTFVIPRDKKIFGETEGLRSKGDIIMAYPDFFSYWIWENVHEAEMQSMQANFNLVSIKLQPESDYELMLNVIKERKKLRGIIIMPPSTDLPKNVLEKIDLLEIPVVILGPFEQARAFKNIYEVRNDHFQSGYLKMSCLLKHGHRRIGLVPNEPPTFAGREHLRGVKQALYDHGMRWKDLVLPDTDAVPWQNPAKNGYIQANEVLDKAKDLTAILSDTVDGASGVLRVFHERAIRCPEDISLVTAHPNPHIEKYSCPRLSTITASAPKNITAALNLIVNTDSANGKSILIGMELNEYESVKDINGDS